MQIDYPGFGRIVVDGETFEHDVVIEGGAVRPRVKKPSRALKGRYGHTPLTVNESIPWSGPRLVIGSGHSAGLPITQEVHEEAARRGVELVILPTAEAVTMLSGSGDANAILHVTC